MCVRFDSHLKGYFVWDAKRGMEIELPANHSAVLASESVFPGKPAQIVVPNSDGFLYGATATWGLNRNITRQGKWEKERYYNARSETIHRLGVFKEAFL